MTSFLLWWTLTTTLFVSAGVAALVVLVEPRRAQRVRADLRAHRGDRRQ